MDNELTMVSMTDMENELTMVSMAVIMKMS
jgi:hypothetical protein